MAFALVGRPGIGSLANLLINGAAIDLLTTRRSTFVVRRAGVLFDLAHRVTFAGPLHDAIRRSIRELAHELEQGLFQGTIPAQQSSRLDSPERLAVVGGTTEGPVGRAVVGAAWDTVGRTVRGKVGLLCINECLVQDGSPEPAFRFNHEAS